MSYIKSLDIFLGVCFFIGKNLNKIGIFFLVFASLLEYATVGFLMKRQKVLPQYNSHSYNNTVWYELDDQSNSVRLCSTSPLLLQQQTMGQKKRKKNFNNDLGVKVIYKNLN